MRLPRPVVLAAVALAAATSAGCSVTNPLVTQLEYEPGDGVEARLGPYLTFSSVLIAADDAAGPGNLVARITNDGPQPRTVQINAVEAGVTVLVEVPGNETVAIGPEGDEQVLLEPVGGIPGSLVPVTVTGPDGESEVLDVPVFDSTFDRYADLVPDPDAGVDTV